MSNFIKLNKDDILPLLNQIKLDKNVLNSIEELNYSMESILNVGTKSTLRVHQGLLEVIGGFNSLPRKLCVNLHESKVYINLVELIKSIFSYKGVILVDYDIKLVNDVSKIHIELPFLDYDEYYRIYERDYMRYVKLPEESKRYLKFKSIANYVGDTAF